MELLDLLTAALTVTLRRADEMGDAITARGGIGQLSAVPSRAKRADWLAMSITVAVCLAAIFLDVPPARP
jgi:energy-coupling factor transporter transmembrane protein EcfT